MHGDIFCELRAIFPRPEENYVQRAKYRHELYNKPMNYKFITWPPIHIVHLASLEVGHKLSIYKWHGSHPERRFKIPPKLFQEAQFPDPSRQQELKFKHSVYFDSCLCSSSTFVLTSLPLGPGGPLIPGGPGIPRSPGRPALPCVPCCPTSP